MPTNPKVVNRVVARSRTSAGQLFVISRPVSPDLHLVRSEAARSLLLPNGNRIYDLDEVTFAALEAATENGDSHASQAILQQLHVVSAPVIDEQPLTEPPLRALSLAVAQKCNLGCTYCYAQQGEFGGQAKNMPEAIALDSVDLLFRDVRPGERVNLAFMGGEPLMNRDAIRKAVARALQCFPSATFGI